jgi:hypothetical protein
MKKILLSFFIILLNTFVGAQSKLVTKWNPYTESYETTYEESYHDMKKKELDNYRPAEYNPVMPNLDLMSNAAKKLQEMNEREQNTKKINNLINEYEEFKIAKKEAKETMHKISNFLTDYDLRDNIPKIIKEGSYNPVVIYIDPKYDFKNVFSNRKVTVRNNTIVEYYNSEGKILKVLKSDTIVNGKTTLFIQDPEDGEILQRTIYF